MESNIICPISQTAMSFAFSAKIFDKYDVNYYRCQDCGLLKTEHPFWLNEAYENAINDTDTGVIARNLTNSNILEYLIPCLRLENGKALDVAGGYGLLARMLRDKGFDCYTTDKYCQNLFAKSFEPGDSFKADILFAFEVLEHIENPVSFLDDIFNRYNCKTLVFSTLTFTEDVPPNDWWYYSFEGGQHITFYQKQTLKKIADHFNLYYYSLDGITHIYTESKLSYFQRSIIFNSYVHQKYVHHVKKMRRGFSKTWEDHYKLKEQKCANLKEQNAKHTKDGQN